LRVKGPLLDFLAADAAYLGQGFQVPAGGGVTDLKLARDQQATDAVFDEVIFGA
jgi:hypothetical protein